MYIICKLFFFRTLGNGRPTDPGRGYWNCNPLPLLRNKRKCDVTKQKQKKERERRDLLCDKNPINMPSHGNIRYIYPLIWISTGTCKKNFTTRFLKLSHSIAVKLFYNKYIPSPITCHEVSGNCQIAGFCPKYPRASGSPPPAVSNEPPSENFCLRA